MILAGCLIPHIQVVHLLAKNKVLTIFRQNYPCLIATVDAPTSMPHAAPSFSLEST